MSNIKCTKCGEIFKIDESGYAEILKQVRDSSFNEEVSKRLKIAEKEKNDAVQIAEAKAKTNLQEKLAEKDVKVSELLSQLKSAESEKKNATQVLCTRSA